MSITIKRNTGWVGMASKIHIEVNGEKVASVMEKKDVIIEIPNSKASLKVKQSGIKSNEIVVKDGDILQIKSVWWYRYNFPLTFIIYFLIFSFVRDSKYRIIILLSVGAVFLILMYLMKGFIIKKVE